MKLDSSVTAVVTGAASGLGEATARMLAARGVKVGILDMNAEGGAKVADEIGGAFAPCDITDQAQTEAGFAALRGANGQERVLINCAGTGIAVKTVARDRKDGSIQPHPIDLFDKIVQLNLVGSFRCLVIAASGMMTLDPLDEDGARGVVVNTASVAAEDGQIGQAAYSASKNGVVGMTLPIARDLAREGVRVSTILPGLFNTPLFQMAPDKVRQALEAQTPFPSRLGKPEEFAQLVVSICENGMFNGESVRLDGAIRMAPR